MSNELEAIVRPSQKLDYAPAKITYAPGQVGAARTHLTIGKSGSGKMFNASTSYNQSYYCDAIVNELVAAEQAIVKKMKAAEDAANNNWVTPQGVHT